MKRLSGDQIEKFLLVTVCGLAISVFYSHTGMTVFGLASIGALLVWRYYLRQEPLVRIPTSVLVLTSLYFLIIPLSLFVSEDTVAVFAELKKVRHVLVAGLLFTAPLRDQYRKYALYVFFGTAIIDGLVGIFQYLYIGDIRPRGFDPNQILYAGKIAFACGSAVILLLMAKNSAKRDTLYLVLTVLVSFFAILLSQSRGVWIALLAACCVPAYVYNRRLALRFFIALFLVFGLIFSFSSSLRDRATSIVTSIYSEDYLGNTGTRLELWKGSLLIFKESPVLGTGIGDFGRDSLALIAAGKMKAVPTVDHAHNIYFHTLATRGIIGLVVLVSLFAATIRWALQHLRTYGGIGGYFILLSSLLAMVGGLTENNIEISRYLAAYCFILGVAGPLVITTQGIPIHPRTTAKVSIK
jgi:O-antigen ligase